MDVISRAQDIIQREGADCTGFPCDTIQRYAIERAKLEEANARLSHEMARLVERLSKYEQE
jgi:hypothetical protein